MEHIAVTKISKNRLGEVLETRDMTLNPKTWANIVKKNPDGALVEWVLRKVEPTFAEPKELISKEIESTIVVPQNNSKKKK